MTRTHEILERLIAFDTVSDRSNLALIDYVQDLLTSAGARVTRLAAPDAPKAGLYAEIGPPGAGIVLSGHSDVVPVAGQDWTRDPFRLTRDGDRLFGRGTTDMKGFVAAMLAAAERAATQKLQEPLKLVLSYDEEVGCVGIAQMQNRLADLMGQPRVALIGEPTQMQVAVGHKGKASYTAVTQGEAGHSALAPNFTNALHGAADLVQAIRALQADLAAKGARDDAYDIPYSTLHVGTLQGGTALNIVPDRAELRFEIRHLAAEAPEAILARLDPCGAEILQTGGYPGLDTPVDADVTAKTQAWAGTATTKVGFGTEAGTFHALGVPSVVCGPGSMSGQGHKVDEYIEASQLAACDAMLARIIEELCT